MQPPSRAHPIWESPINEDLSSRPIWEGSIDPTLPSVRVTSWEAPSKKPRTHAPSAFAQDAEATRAVEVGEFATTIEDPSRRALFEQFQGWAICQTKNDKHSLFRSIACLLLEDGRLRMLRSDIDALRSLIPSTETKALQEELTKAYQDLARTEFASQRAILVHVCELKKAIENREAEASRQVDIGELIANAESMLAAGRSPLEILSNERISNGWVGLLRNLSAGWWKTAFSKKCVDEENARLFKLLAPQGEYQVDAYQKEITSSGLICPGGCLEIIALRNALKQTIRVVDLDPNGERPSTGQRFTPEDMYVLCGAAPNQGHYDAFYHPGRTPATVLSEMKGPFRVFIPFGRVPGSRQKQSYGSSHFPAPETIDPWRWDRSYQTGEPIPVEAFGHILPENHRCRDVLELGGCFIVKIPADGHCFFRGLSALLMGRPETLDGLIARADELQSSAPPDLQLKDLFTKTKDLISSGRLPGEIVRKVPDLSKGWVLFLRHLAINYWAGEFAKNPSGPIQTLLAAERSSFGIEDDDLAMANYMSTTGSYEVEIPRWGDQTEVTAIHNVLSISIQIVDLTTPRAQRIKIGGLLPTAAVDANSFYLLLSPSPAHYDSLLIPGQR